MSSQPTAARPIVMPAHGRAQSGGVEIIQPESYVDRRAEPRVACDDRGVMMFPATGEVIACRILDQSASGARVAFDTIGGMPSEIWLLATEQSTARRGTAAWSTMNRMGLKFDLVQQLAPGAPRPPKVPAMVFEAWLRLTGQSVPAPAPQPAPPPADDDVLYFD